MAQQYSEAKASTWLTFTVLFYLSIKINIAIWSIVYFKYTWPRHNVQTFFTFSDLGDIC